MGNGNSTNCSTTYPDVPQFNEGLGAAAVALYTLSGLFTAILFAQWLYMAKLFMSLPRHRRRLTLWVDSVYLVVCLFTMVSISLPKAR